MKIIISLGLFIIFTAQAMQQGSQKRVREIMEFTYAKNHRQIDSFFEEYNRGTIRLNADNTVNFTDLHDNTIEYTIAHSQAMAVINDVIKFRKPQIMQKNGEFTCAWLKNSVNSDFSPEFKHIAMAFRFLMFHSDLDLLGLAATDSTPEGSKRASARVFMENRAKYRQAFASGNQQAFNEAKIEPINPMYDPFDKYLHGFQEMARNAKSNSAHK